jgi:putative restriction endonuclease
VRAYVGVTDGDWYRYLASRSFEEVNFWRPGGGRAFLALQPGELFFFKTHAPDNRVVGGGFYSGFAALTLDEAWRFYGEANGVASLLEMRTRIAKYRREPVGPDDNPRIGCVFLRDVVFLDSPASAPPEFAGNIVQGKGYDLAAPSVRDYFAELIDLMAVGAAGGHRMDITWTHDGPVFGDPRLAPYRLGQRAFQGVVLQAYGGRCAVTADRIRPVLQAAHIRPVTKGGEHRLDNGMLLRSDVHTLFDAGYLGIDPTHRLVVSPRLREEFGNGEEFYERARSREPLVLPARRADKPNREFLEWHMDEVFKAS